MPLPDFFVIGAPKAGTSSLYDYLGQHPQVFMSPVKEPAYFKGDAETGAGTRFTAPRAASSLDEYARLFEGAGDERAIGEATPTYLQSAEAAERIRVAVPDARLVAVLRNPVDRAFSGYSMRVSQGTEDLKFAEAVAVELDEQVDPVSRRWYLRPGFYGRHLAAYLDRFDREQLRVFLYEDLSRRPEWLLREVFEFLGVDPSFVPEMADRNVTQYPVRSESVDRLLRGVPGKALVRRVVPAATWARAKRAVRRRNSRVPEFPADLRRELVELYRDDIRLTEELIGRDLSAWTDRRDSRA